MRSHWKITAAATIAVVLTAGCASQTRTEREFGESVRLMKTNQTYDVGASLYPSQDAVTGGDGTRLENVVEMHRNDIADPRQVQKSMSPGVSTVETQ